MNRKAVYRVLKQKRWFVHQRAATPRPRVRGLGESGEPEQRTVGDGCDAYPLWAGWLGHLAAVIDCHDREVIGYEFALRSRAKEAERAVEAACLQRFGTLRPVDAPVLRSDNGLIFQSRRFRQACRDYRLQQEFITPYTPEQNGIIERFFRSLKEECVWQHTFQTFEEARRIIRDWVHWYNHERPHQALGYRSPSPISCATRIPGGLISGEHYTTAPQHLKPSRRNAPDSHEGWYNHRGQVSLAEHSGFRRLLFCEARPGG